MTVQLVVMDSYVERFVIFAYVLVDHLIVMTRLLQLYKKKKIKVHACIHNYVKK